MMMRTLPAIVALAASARAGDTIKTGRLVGGDLFLCANTQLQHADMLYRVDTATMNVTASLAMPPDADADGWKKMARNSYCNAAGMVVDGATLWVGVNEYLVSYDLPLAADSTPATSEKYAAGGWACPDGYLSSLKSLSMHGGKLYGVATCDGDAPDAASLVVRFHKKGTPESWASFENDGGTLDDLLVATGGRLWVPGTSEGRYAQALYEVLDGGGEGNVTLAAAAATLANAAFIADLSGVAAVGDAAVLATGQSCTPAPPPPALAGTPDLPPYCAYKESPKALVARVALADGGNATIGDVRDVAAYKPSSPAAACAPSSRAARAAARRALRRGGETMVIEEIRATQQNIWVELDATADIDLLLQTAAGETILEFDGASSTHWYPNQQSFAFNGMSFTTCVDGCTYTLTAGPYYDGKSYAITGDSSYASEYVYVDGATTEDLVLSAVGYQTGSGTVSILSGANTERRARAFAERCSFSYATIIAIANSDGFTVELARARALSHTIAKTDAGTDADADALPDADSCSDGDGWDDGVTYEIFSLDGDAVATGTLVDGAFETQFVCLADGCYTIDVTSEDFVWDDFVHPNHGRRLSSDISLTFADADAHRFACADVGCSESFCVEAGDMYDPDACADADPRRSVGGPRLRANADADAGAEPRAPAVSVVGSRADTYARALACPDAAAKSLANANPRRPVGRARLRADADADTGTEPRAPAVSVVGSRANTYARALAGPDAAAKSMADPDPRRSVGGARLRADASADAGTEPRATAVSVIGSRADAYARALACPDAAAKSLADADPRRSVGGAGLRADASTDAGTEPRAPAVSVVGSRANTYARALAGPDAAAKSLADADPRRSVGGARLRADAKTDAGTVDGAEPRAAAGAFATSFVMAKLEAVAVPDAHPESFSLVVASQRKAHRVAVGLPDAGPVPRRLADAIVAVVCEELGGVNVSCADGRRLAEGVPTLDGLARSEISSWLDAGDSEAEVDEAVVVAATAAPSRGAPSSRRKSSSSTDVYQAAATSPFMLLAAAVLLLGAVLLVVVNKFRYRGKVEAGKPAVELTSKSPRNVEFDDVFGGAASKKKKQKEKRPSLWTLRPPSLAPVEPRDAAKTKTNPMAARKSTAGRLESPAAESRRLRPSSASSGIPSRARRSGTSPTPWRPRPRERVGAGSQVAGADGRGGLQADSPRVAGANPMRRPTYESKTRIRDAWEELEDPATGRAYWHNPSTGETSWTNPNAETIPSAEVLSAWEPMEIQRDSESAVATSASRDETSLEASENWPKTRPTQPPRELSARSIGPSETPLISTSIWRFGAPTRLATPRRSGASVEPGALRRARLSRRDARRTRRRRSACSRDVVVWSIARDFATRTPSAFWENARFYARGCDRADAAAMQGAYERTLRWSVLDGRRHAPGRGPCTFFSRLAETLNATLTPFDGRRSVARGGTHAALVTRVEDTAEWEGIVADFLPEFSFDATCRGKHVRRGSDRNYDAFLERVTPPTAAQAALYATCDTAAFYDATWNRVVNRATGAPHDTRGCLSA
ncbi:hypothetical protein JL721_5579 [Aureococcus anophagefferens]|nr:hypothetical protein JL721_5579 [Aureococcus anophagefferens]